MRTQTETVSDLQKLPDPEFFTRWAQVRQRYALTPRDSPCHAARKQDYADVVAEYYRRLKRAGGAS